MEEASGIVRRIRSLAIAAVVMNESCSHFVFGRSSTIVRSRLTNTPTATASITRPGIRRATASTASAARRWASVRSASQ